MLELGGVVNKVVRGANGVRSICIKALATLVNNRNSPSFGLNNRCVQVDRWTREVVDVKLAVLRKYVRQWYSLSVRQSII